MCLTVCKIPELKNGLMEPCIKELAKKANMRTYITPWVLKAVPCDGWLLPDVPLYDKIEIPQSLGYGYIHAYRYARMEPTTGLKEAWAFGVVAHGYQGCTYQDLACYALYIPTVDTNKERAANITTTIRKLYEKEELSVIDIVKHFPKLKDTLEKYERNIPCPIPTPLQ